MKKEEFKSWLLRHQDMTEESIDTYWEFFEKVPMGDQGDNSYSGDEFKMADDLHGWQLLAKMTEPLFSASGAFKGWLHSFYRII